MRRAIRAFFEALRTCTIDGCGLPRYNHNTLCKMHTRQFASSDRFIPKSWMFSFTIPVLRKRMTEIYDIRTNSFLSGQFALTIAIGTNFSDIHGVSRFRWFPFLIWAWSATPEVRAKAFG